MFHFKGSSSNM